VAAFLDRARSNLDIVQYDLHLGAPTCEILRRDRQA
jgi:hypothetical protein